MFTSAGLQVIKKAARGILLLGTLLLGSGFRNELNFKRYDPFDFITTQFNSCAITTDRKVKCWGRDEFGQLADGNVGSAFDSATPLTIPSLTNAVALGGGRDHLCAIISDGTIKCWGSDVNGQLGNGATAGSTTPVSVNTISNAVQITRSSSYHTCALLSDRTVSCWGDQSNGKLGNGSTASASVTSPASIAGLTNVIYIGTGLNHTCAVISDGTAKCWGTNSSSQLGHSGTTDQGTPGTVTGLAGAVQIEGGDTWTCALLSNGTVKCWGTNAQGLGDGVNTTSASPVTVSGITTAKQLSGSGRGTMCALLADRTVKCWGFGDVGQLGNGGTAHSNVPVTATLISHVSKISTGGFHTCVRMYNHDMKCWGANSSKQIGDGTTTTPKTTGSHVMITPVRTYPLPGRTFASVGAVSSANNKVAGASWNFVTGADLEAGNLGVMIVSADNLGTSTGNTSEHTSVTDAAGNTWIKQREYSLTQGSAAAGQTVSVWTTIATTTLTAGSNITVNFSASVTAKASTVWEFTISDTTPLSIGGAMDDWDGGADPKSMSLSSLTSRPYLWIRAVGSESSTFGWTAGTNYTAFETLSATTAGAPVASNAAARGEFRIFTGTGDTSDPTGVAADNASIYMALY
jgi:hypothetical protein